MRGTSRPCASKMSRPASSTPPERSRERIALTAFPPSQRPAQKLHQSCFLPMPCFFQHGGLAMAHKTTESLLQTEVQIPAGEHQLIGTLSRPAGSEIVVVFANGSGSGRF